jgi:hypothetical protein
MESGGKGLMANLSITAAWDEAMGFVRREGRLLFPISFMLVALPAALAEAVTPAPAAAGQPPAAGLWLALFPIALLLSAIGNLAITYLALRPGTSVAEALRRGAARLLPLLGVAVLAGIALFLMFMIAMTVASMLVPGAVEAAKAGVTDAAIGKAMLLGAVLLLPAVVFLAARLLLVTPLAAGEEGGAFRLIARSWGLTAGHGWRLAGTLLLVTIAYGIGLIAIQSLAGLAVVALFGPPGPGSIGAFLITLLGAGVATLVTPYLATFFARIYAQLSA